MLKADNANRWICYAVGYVFIISAMMKLIMGDFLATFIQLGLPFPQISIFILAIIEISCGAFIIAQVYVKQAAIPLIVIMFGAIFVTKLPVISQDGILPFLFTIRLDLVMIILLFLLWRLSPGKQW